MNSAPSERSPWQRLQWPLAVLFVLMVFLYCNRNIVTGHNAPTWDAFTYYTPEFTLVADYARAGRLLLWDPWINGGTPDNADPQVGAASPIMILVGTIAGGTEKGFRAYWLLIWFLGPLGMLLIARHLDAPAWAAVVVALAYGFCGFYVGHAEHTTFVYSFSSLPFIFWRFDAALKSLRFWAAIEAGALWGLSALGGYPSLTIMTGGFLGLWALGRCCSSKSDFASFQARPTQTRFVFAVLALILVFCVGAVVLAPTYAAFFKEGAGYSERAGALSRGLALDGAMSPSSLLNFASPYLILLRWPWPKLNPGLWPDSDISLQALYLGALPLILATLALLERPKSTWRWWLTGIIVFALTCSVGKHLPVRGWLYDCCPPTRYFRHAAAFRAFAIFGIMILALLAGRDLQIAISKPSSRIWVKLLCSAVVISTGAMVSYVYIITHFNNFAEQFHRGARHLVRVWLGAIAISLLVLLFAKARRWLPALLIILALVDASLTARITEPLVSGGSSARQIWDRLNAGHRPGIGLGENGLQRELRPPSWAGGSITNNNLPLKILTFYNDEVMSNRFHVNFEHHPLLQNMAIGSERIWFSADAAIVSPSDAAYAALVRRTDELGVPVLVVHPAQEMVMISQSGLAINPVAKTNSQETSEVNAIVKLNAVETISTKILRYSPNHLDLSVSCRQAGWLIVTDRWSSGWHARVNGKPSEVFGGNFIFRAVRVEAGENTIQFSYDQTAYFALVAISWSTLATIFMLPLILKSRPIHQ